MAAKPYSFFIFWLLLCFSFNAYAQNFNEMAGFDKKVFDYHFDRADRELDPSSWIKEAKKGIGFAVAAWERAALELYGDPALYREAGFEIARWTEEELERRFAQWLFFRFFGTDTGRSVNTMEEAVEIANRLFAYHTDEEGNILYDKETGDPESIRPKEGRSIEEDLILWHQMVNSTGETELLNYKLSVVSAFPELLFYIKDDGRIGFENHLAELVNQSLFNLQAEFEALLAREERLFVARRTGDIWSLRKKSENESASAISARLIRDAENMCSLGIISLEERIEAARAGTGDIALLGEDWLNAFQEQFDRGLKTWAEAEERFLIRRMEWERDSGERYQEGQEAWRIAFAELEQEKLAWEEKARELFYAGEQLFINASETLNIAIREAKEEFQKEAALRVNIAVERINALVDMYITCGSVMIEAKNSVDFWLPRFILWAAPPENALENGTLADWVRQKMNIPFLMRGNIKTAGMEIIRWAELYSQYKVKAKEILLALEKEFGLAMSVNGKALTAVLELPSEDFFLDEYQIELLRTMAIAEYWEQRLSIAEAVSAYADDLTAGRMTEAESLQQWKDAKDSYDAALVAYAAIQEKLKKSGNDLAQIQLELHAAAVLLAEEEKKLEELNSRYSLQMAAYRVYSSDFILQQLGSYYETLTDLVETRQKDDFFYSAYLKAEQKYIEEYLLECEWALLGSIVQNETDPETKQTLLSLLSAASGIDWYFSVTGKEKTAEAVKTLEEEGLYRRLERESAESEKAAMLFSVYLDYFNNVPGLQQEAAKFAWLSFPKVFEEFGIANTGKMPDMDFLSEGLLLYCKEKGLSPAVVTSLLLVRLDEESALLPMMLQSEFDAWKEALMISMAAKTLYNNINVPEEINQLVEKYEECMVSSLDLYYTGGDIQTIVRDGSLYYYQLTFLSAYNDFLAVIAFADGKEHWRSYISENGVVAWKEGFLADTSDFAAEALKRMTEAFLLVINSSPSVRQAEFALTVKSYLYDQEKLWEGHEESFEFSIAQENYSQEMEKLHNKIELEETIKQQITKLGFEYNNIPPQGALALKELQNISAELAIAEAKQQEALNNFNKIADAFSKAGAGYDVLYSQANYAFKKVEETRINYEKQDAIQRWASTAYLNNSSMLADDLLYYKEPKEDLAYALEHRDRAQIALAALKNLYNAGQSIRPYENEEYNVLYNEYENSFSRMLLTLKAKTEVSSFLESEQNRNLDLYYSLMNKISSFISQDIVQETIDYYIDYNPPLLRNCSWLDFIRINENGSLGISYNSDTFRLTQINKTGAASLADYFQKDTSKNNGQMSSFENAIIAWTERMAGYGLESMENYQNWGLALGYLIRNLAANNNITAISSSYILPDMGTDGNINLDHRKLNDRLAGYYNNDFLYIQEKAWNSLTKKQKEDLEFMAVLYLSGIANEKLSGFDKISGYKGTEWLYNKADYYKIRVNAIFFKFYVYRPPYLIDHSELDQVFRATKNRRDSYYEAIENGKEEFFSWGSAVSSLMIKYNESLNRIAAMSKQYEKGINWADIEYALINTKSFSNSEISMLKSYWAEMNKYRINIGETALIKSVASALDNLNIWGKGLKENLEEKIGNIYANDEEKHERNQENYRTMLDSFINGETALSNLNTAARLAYGADAPSVKNHLNKMGSIIISNMKKITMDKSAYIKQFNDFANQYIYLIEQAYIERYHAELTVRENIWNRQIVDLNTKLSSWMEASRLILERGRQDWDTGFELMITAFAEWEENFKEKYINVGNAWNTAYMESLKDKEEWINNTINLAANAMNKNLLSIIGTDAESYSKKLDCFMPSSLIDHENTVKASQIIQNILGAAGIVNLGNAFTSVSGSAETVASAVQSGVSGVGLWDSGQVKAAAKDFSLKSTIEMANGRMEILAFQAREIVLEAKNALNEQIAFSNMNFNKNMDELYRMQNGWKRAANNYIKDIVVHSTVFHKAITDTAVIEAYRYFIMDYWELSTDLSDGNLAGLDYIGVQAIIGMAQNEIKQKTLLVFGSDSDAEGLFGNWIGKPPKNENDEGSGELGRLLYALNKWENKHANGIALMTVPFWDKPLWDSRDSWFNAPSIRGTFNIATSIASTIVGAALAPVSFGLSLGISFAINMSDDLLFGAMDLASGNKNWSEFGFDFGKSALINAVSSGSGVLFNGINKAVEGTAKFAGLTSLAANKAGSPIGKTVVNSLMAGVQTVSTSTVTSALSAVTYNNGKINWNKDTFSSGLKQGLISTAVAGTSTFTSGLMNTGLEGFYGKIYTDGKKLSALTGGLIGQGVNFALGGDINLNAFNLNFFNKDLPSMGLLELHIGRDGFSGNFGTNGVDISTGTLASAFRGIEAWKVNYDIWTSDSEAAKNYKSQMRTLYSGNDVNKGFYNSILNKETFVVENRNADYTQTVYDPITGIKMLFLGNDALEDGSRFGLNVVFSHESYRNGLDDGTERQIMETNMAVMGHISTALGLMQTYGYGSIGSAMADEAYDFIKNYNTLFSDSSDEMQKIWALTNIADIFNGYDSSADYWKLVKRNGKWGWADDGSLDFNFDLNDAEIRKAFYQAGGRRSTGTIKAEEMTRNFLQKLGFALNIKDPADTIYFTNANNPIINDIALNNFVNGSYTFVIASKLALNLMKFPTQENINSFNAALLNVQKNGFLMNNPVKYASGLIGQGTDTFPYLPLTGNVEITCLDGYRFNAYGGLGKGTNFPLNDFAKHYHEGVDLVSKNFNVVASTNGSLQLRYDNTYGIRGFLTSETGAFLFDSNHLAVESILNYISVFGMYGTSLVAGNDNQYTLSGVKAGVVIGQMGSTGYSTAAHVDFIVKDLINGNQGSVFGRLYDNRYTNLTVRDWAKKYSGLPTKEWNKAITDYMAMINAN